MFTETRPKLLLTRGYNPHSLSTGAHSLFRVGGYYFVFKRFVDLLGSSLLLLGLMSWLIPLVALLIKLDSSGPIFFVQKRMGKKGRPFVCFKFRSMVPNREADQKQALPNDQRVTKTGRFLRKSNVDELPQLFNVFMGDMSFVGPRPHMLADCRRFSQLIPEYGFRTLVKPGITGLAQVNGFHGPSQHDDEILDRFYWDSYYVEHGSFKVDMKIIFQTIVQRLKFVWTAVVALF